jgi:tryptophan 7-halogenase
MIKSICILGGGTSGLITALILNKWYPTMDIKIVESSTIGIVGVGEGSTEHWANFMRTVGIDLKELLTETAATFKSGIRFENWNGDNEFYMHSLHAEYAQMMPNALPGVMVKLISEEYPHLYPDNIINSRHLHPIENSVNQFHFDTAKLNTFLHTKCKERGVIIVEDDIHDVIISSDGYVTSLLGKNDNIHSAEFFIDSSGFHRVISSKLGAKWIDCKDHLPMDRAFAFPTPYTGDNYPSYTVSKAMSSGWMWRIPTQDRYGNGYVYSSKFLTHEEAVAEVQELFDEPIEVRKSFEFSAGYVDKFWIKNCVSIGLAGSFVEPLEASSIGTSIQQALSLGVSILSWTKEDQYIADVYNKQFELVAKNIIDFVQLHYITKRNDSPFWQYCKNLKLTEFNQETLEHFKSTIPIRSHFTANQWLLFSEHNWLQVLHGLKLFNIDKIKQIWHSQDPKYLVETDRIYQALEIYQQNIESLSHYEAIEFLKQGSVK